MVNFYHKSYGFFENHTSVFQRGFFDHEKQAKLLFYSKQLFNIVKEIVSLPKLNEKVPGDWKTIEGKKPVYRKISCI